VLRTPIHVQRTYMQVRRINKNRLHVSEDLRDFTSLLLKNLVGNLVGKSRSCYGYKRKRTNVNPKRKNKNHRDSPRLDVSVDPQEFNSLLLDNLVDNGSI
jgi:hypothetical protein